MPRTMPHSYSGHRLVRVERVGERWSESADVAAAGATYHYNELGFRGPGFRSDATWRAFIFGESDAIGEGVDFDEIWAVRVAHEIARQRGFERHEVCVMNFADGGASNAHIARMVASQCGQIRPDLVLVNFAEERRAEGWVGGDVYTAGPWLDAEAMDRAIDESPADEDRCSQLRERLARGRAFLRYSDHHQSLLDCLHDILLVQNILRAERVEAYAITRQLNRLFRSSTLDDPIMGPLAGQIDASFLAPFHPLRLRFRNDGSPAHYGPRTHAAVAKRMLTHIGDRSDVTSVWAAALAQ